MTVVVKEPPLLARLLKVSHCIRIVIVVVAVVKLPRSEKESGIEYRVFFSACALHFITS